MFIFLSKLLHVLIYLVSLYSRKHYACIVSLIHSSHADDPIAKRLPSNLTPVPDIKQTMTTSDSSQSIHKVIQQVRKP